MLGDADSVWRRRSDLSARLVRVSLTTLAPVTERNRGSQTCSPMLLYAYTTTSSSAFFSSIEILSASPKNSTDRNTSNSSNSSSHSLVFTYRKSSTLSIKPFFCVLLNPDNHSAVVKLRRSAPSGQKQPAEKAVSKSLLSRSCSPCASLSSSVSGPSSGQPTQLPRS